MRLTVKRADNLINELRFSRGPIYVGRQIGSQIFLPDRAVSRQHTVLYTTTDGKWVVEDLDSANKTYLNSEAVHKSEVTDGDVLGIADFIIEIHIDEADEQEPSMSLEDTLHTTLHEPQVVLRSVESRDAPLVRMQAGRVMDFSYAAGTILKCRSLTDILSSAIDLIFKQFKPYQVWISLRSSPSGPMETAMGKNLLGETVKLDSLSLESKIGESVKTHHYILVPRLPMQSENTKIHSAMIVPIMCNKGCYGILYADNSLDHEHYGISDLDYMIFFSLMTGSHISSNLSK